MSCLLRNSKVRARTSAPLLQSRPVGAGPCADPAVNAVIGATRVQGPPGTWDLKILGYSRGQSKAHRSVSSKADKCLSGYAPAGSSFKVHVPTVMRGPAVG